MRIRRNDLEKRAKLWASLHGKEYGHTPGGYWVQYRNGFYEFVRWNDKLAWLPVTWPMTARELWAFLCGGIYTAEHYVVKEPDNG